MSQLPRQHAELSAMMRFVSYEVTQKVYEIGGKVLPGGGRDCAAAIDAQLDHSNDAVAAARERAQQLRRPHLACIDRARHGNTMTLADHLDPHAPYVVDVRADGPNSAPGRTGNSFGPQLSRQVLDEVHRDAIGCAPGRDQLFGIIRHASLSSVRRLEHINRIATRKRTQNSLQQDPRDRS